MRFLLLLLALPAFGQNWLATKWLSNGIWQWETTDAHNQYALWLEFPTYGYFPTNRTVVSFLTTTNITGNFTGKTLTTSFSIFVTPNTRFAYGGMLNANGVPPGWNTNTTPANVRFFVSSFSGTYNNLYADYHPDLFWWSKEGAMSVDQGDGIHTITASLDPTKWSNAAGQINAAAFSNVIRNVAQIGLSFGGGWYYDVGVGVLEGTGLAWFALLSFDVN